MISLVVNDTTFFLHIHFAHMYATFLSLSISLPFFFSKYKLFSSYYSNKTQLVAIIPNLK